MKKIFVLSVLLLVFSTISCFSEIGDVIPIVNNNLSYNNCSSFCYFQEGEWLWTIAKFNHGVAEGTKNVKVKFQKVGDTVVIKAKDCDNCKEFLVTKNPDYKNPKSWSSKYSHMYFEVTESEIVTYYLILE